MPTTTLTLFTSGGAPRHFEISQRRVVLGRATDCDLRIPLPSVSRRHCEIVVKGGTTWVRDLGSRNGTLLNGNPVHEAPLDEGDKLGIGPVRFYVDVREGVRAREPAGLLIG